MIPTSLDIPTGYKQTEVGVVPEDWAVTTLQTVLDPLRSVRYGIVQPGEFVPRGPLMLRSQDYSKGWTTPDEMHRVSFALEKQYRNARIRAGDLIMTIVGAGIGQVVFAPRWLDGALLSRSTGRVAVDPSKAASRFIAACLESPSGKRQVMDCQKEGAQPVVSCPDLARFLIPLPSLAEQEAIAEALGDADALIESLEQLVAKKRHLKQAAMQQLLTGKKRLPGFEGEWESKTVGELVDMVRNGAVYRPDASGRSRITRIETISAGVIDFSRTGTFEFSPELAHYRMITGDILFSHINSVEHIGKTAIYNGGRELFHGMNLLLVRVNSSADARFLHQLLNLGATRQRLRALAKQAVSQASINTAELKAFELWIPDPAEQVAIAGILADMDAEIEAIEAKLAKARQIKQGMMQELLTGRTRLV